MKQIKLFSMMLLACGVMHGQQPTKTSNSRDTWQIKWDVSDEFNGGSVNTSKWITGGNRLPDVTAWKWKPENVKIVQDGGQKVLKLTMRHNTNNRPEGRDNPTYFNSGMIKSQNTKTYGYYEARIKGASIGEGVCPAFWLFSNFKDDVTSVRIGELVYCEIDVVELQQFDFHNGHQDDIKDMDHNLHCAFKKAGNPPRRWQRPKPYAANQLNKYRAPWDPRNGYHIYGCEVNENKIIWYVDGRKVAESRNTYWKRPMNIALSLGLRKPFAVFGSNRNNPKNPMTDAKARAALPGMPTSMYVDYVRFWEKTGTRGRRASASADPVAGGNDVQLNSELSVYPNPASDIVNVTVAGSVKSKIPVQIYNIAGKKVLTTMVKGGVNNQVDVSRLTKGVYILSVDDKKQQLVIK